MKSAYARLHRLGYAHSVDVWDGGRLVGGLYGVSVGRAFHAESMVSLESGGSKVALAGLGRHLAARGWPCFDAQIENPHLRFMGGEVWTRARFLAEFRPRTAGREPCHDWAAPAVPAAALAVDEAGTSRGC
jgi:leucyl/phenylalanyl-tRNA--protein transferase